ncbi:hypothetical protein LX36DRAFT_733552 [Colletotrichum falcatum]|nr:hypothetical protein LX36DRAFT_733552 [Colletotrichum falcatum]
MTGKHGLPSGLSDALFSPDHKKRRIVKRPKPWEDVDDSQSTQCSSPKPFTRDDADALSRQVDDFEREYRKESCIVYTDTSPRDIELRIARSTLHRHHRAIRDLLRHTFFLDPSCAVLRPPAEAHRALTAHRAALARHQALWHHRRAARRTLRAARRLATRTTALAAAEAASDADAEHDPRDPVDSSRHRVAFPRRRRWYRTVRRDMRRRGQWVSRAAPGPCVEREAPDVRGDPGVRVRFFEPVAGDWILPAHVRDARDLDVLLNQLGLRFTPVDDW